MSGRQSAELFEGELTQRVRLPYLLFLPRGYEERRGRRWPLMLFLHGSGERGGQLAKVKAHGPPKLVQKQADFPFIVVSPQCAQGEHWSKDTLLALLEEVTGKRRVDPRRVYLTGLSMGGYGVWALGLACPERFAAIAPLCGGGDVLPILLADRRRLKAIQSLPVWAFHGAKDPVVPVEESQRMIAALREVGNDARLTVYPEAGHDCWTETYDNPALYSWLLAHRRPAPAARPRR